MMTDDKAQRALTLWKRWFEKSGDPLEEVGHRYYCFFCYEDQPNHEPDCIYLAAKELMANVEAA